MTQETATPTAFEQALERYTAGESAATLLPVFKELCQQFPKSGALWSCLAWLYLLEDQGDRAYKAATKSVKLEPQSPQHHVNLVLAMLVTGQKGVRKHIELAQRIMSMNPEVRSEVEENLADGLARKPDWPEINRVQAWLAEG
ncbi:MAG: hypothetical protein AAGG02_18650 [Cyanobacteria bacterium P01_H01_bin.15]